MNTGNKLAIWPLVLVAIIVGRPWATAAAGPQVYAGPSADSSFLVDGAGTLSAWGDNAFGDLAVGGDVDQSIPTAVPFPSGVHGWREVVSAEGSFGGRTYAIGDDSQLYAAGYGFFLTVEGYNLTLVPPPDGIGGWASVAASDQGWLAVSTNGPIYGNIDGAVSWPPLPGAKRWTQVAVCSYYGVNVLDLFALDDRGKLFGVYSGTAWFPSPSFVEIPAPAGATAWTNISAGAYGVLAMANDGNLYSWQNSQLGYLGVDNEFYYTNRPQLIALPAGKTGWNLISAGSFHSLATTADGQLFVWGFGNNGQLGLGDDLGYKATPTAVPNLTNVTAIAAGREHSLAVAGDQVLAWGLNADGELGAGFTSAYYPLPLASQFNYDISSTNLPLLPVVSITAEDSFASEGTWLSTLGQAVTNTGRFEISRTVAGASDLTVNLTIGGTATNGVDYATLPVSIIIPASSNSAPLLVIPTGSTLALDPSTVVVGLVPDRTYQLGNSTNAIVTLIQYETPTTIPLPALTLQLFVGTNLNGATFDIQSSTNLTDWTDLGTGINKWGIVTVTETNQGHFRQRFFRAVPVSNP